MTPSSSIWDMSYSQMLSLPHPDVVGMGGEGGGPPAKIIHGNFFKKAVQPPQVIKVKGMLRII